MKKFKKIIFTFLFALLMVPVLNAQNVKTEQELQDAVKVDGTIVLDNDIEVANSLRISDGQNITLDLNGNNITFITEGNSIYLYHGTLNIIGKGVLKEQLPYFSPIIVKGSENVSDVNYTTLTVGKDVTLDGFYGLMLDQFSGRQGKPYAYGVNVTVYGKLVGEMDSSGAGAGLYLNGSVQHKENYPVINLVGATIESTITGGIYAAGYAKWNITDSKIIGTDYGIGTKSGIFNIKNTTIRTTGEAQEGTYNGNGINGTGAALQIESNNGYAGNISISIKDSKFESVNGNAFYHYFAAKDSSQVVQNSLLDLTIDGVDFKGGVKFVDKDNVRVLSGTFSTEDIKDYLVNGYKLVKVNNSYVVSNVEVTENVLLNGKSNVTYIKSGTEVTISTIPNKFIEKITVTTASNKEVTIEDNKFIMPEEMVNIKATLKNLYGVLFTANENVEDVKYTVDGKEVDFIMAGETVTIDYTIKENYVLKAIKVINLETGKEVVVKNNTFVMPEGTVEVELVVEEKGEIKEVVKAIEVSEDIDKTIVEDIINTNVDNSNTGLLESVDNSKLNGVTETDKVEVFINAILESYDKTTNTLVFNIKPYYTINGVNKGIIPNEILTKSIKIELPIPSNITDTHVKVVHKSGDKIIDTKIYEIKTRDGKKYITIETESFSTFELNFYTPNNNVENPQTGDNIMFYVGTLIISLLGISAIVVVKKHF